MAEKKVSITDDTFVHFTYANRAKEIVDQGVLLAKPPYDKFGIEGVQAVSVKHGQFVPQVQLTHLSDSDQEVVAVVFKTRTLPKIGYPEEVIWNKDVQLINPTIVSKEDAASMLQSGNDDDYVLRYESLIETLLGV